MEVVATEQDDQGSRGPQLSCVKWEIRSDVAKGKKRAMPQTSSETDFCHQPVVTLPRSLYLPGFLTVYHTSLTHVTPDVWSSEYERINFCCVKPPSLWYFIIAALGTRGTYVGNYTRK